MIITIMGLCIRFGLRLVCVTPAALQAKMGVCAVHVQLHIQLERGAEIAETRRVPASTARYSCCTARTSGCRRRSSRAARSTGSANVDGSLIVCFHGRARLWPCSAGPRFPPGSATRFLPAPGILAFARRKGGAACPHSFENGPLLRSGPGSGMAPNLGEVLLAEVVSPCERVPTGWAARPTRPAPG